MIRTLSQFLTLFLTRYLTRYLTPGLFVPWLMMPINNAAATDQEVLPDGLRERLLSLPEGVMLGIAVVDAKGQLVFQRDAQTELPTASAIKTAILLEFFDQYHQTLSSSPEKMARILSDPKHPAVAHFSPAEQKEISAALSDASIKRLGWIMIDQRDELGKKYSNIAYNAATNLAIALLGGPAETTRAIHARDDSLLGITVHRYMLADRKANGDNTATPRALASLHQKISSRQLPMIPAEVLEEVLRILHTSDFPQGAKLYSKGGSLSSDPVTRVQSGWYQEGQATMNFAIMVAQPLLSTESGKSQYRVLADLSPLIYLDLKSAFLARGYSKASGR